MADLGKAFKEKLGELLAAGHRAFGPVNERKPFPDDDEGGGGLGELSMFESHPYLENVPDGAPSDLSHDVTMRNDAQELAEEREQDATPELRKNLELANKKQLTAISTPTPNPPR